MKQKRKYQAPLTTMVQTMTENPFLAGSSSATGPTANFMSNPGVSNEDEE